MIAYDSMGRPYIVSDSVSDSESLGVLVTGFKKRGLTDWQIQEKLGVIEYMAMDMMIAGGHPNPLVCEIAARPDLSLDDKDEIYEMTQGIPDSFGDCHGLCRGSYSGVVSGDCHGLRVISRKSMSARKAADTRALKIA